MRNPESSSLPLPRSLVGETTSCTKARLKRGPWTTEEDSVLVDYINRNGEGRWRTLPKRAGLLRCGKSCRLRWMNYLRPSVKLGRIEADEEDLILRLHRLLGNKWSLIAGRIPGRTDNEIKNYWNSHLRKKLISQGIDPKTHLPLGQFPAPVSSRYPDLHNDLHIDLHNSNPSSRGGNGRHDTRDNNNVHFSGGGGSEIGSVTPIDATLGDEEVEDVFSSFLNSLMNDETPLTCQNLPAAASNSGYGQRAEWGTAMSGSFSSEPNNGTR